MEEEGVQVIHVEIFGSKGQRVLRAADEYPAQGSGCHRRTQLLSGRLPHPEEDERDGDGSAGLRGQMASFRRSWARWQARAADNVYVSSMWSADRKDGKRCRNSWKTTRRPMAVRLIQFAASAYDGVYMAMDAMQRAGTTTDHKIDLPMRWHR